MKVSVLRIFIINVLWLCVQGAMACAWTAPERWYMYEYDTPTFSDYFQIENLKYWNSYCKPEQPMFWFNLEDVKEAASKKSDTQMLGYLDALGKYIALSESVSSDSWEYPSAEDLAKRKRTLDGILAECGRHRSGALSDRWLLLEMRANMLRGNYAANVKAWEDKGKDAPAGYVKEMMRNIYANALLHTGRKVDAWNVYAAQNDRQSLLWSARKYTNLAGIKYLYNIYHDAPVLKYLLERYVNTIQDVVDMYYDNLHARIEAHEREQSMNSDLANYWEMISGDAYARIDKDYMGEIKEFIKFADDVANDKDTANPCMWETASALCSYYIGEYRQAGSMIDRAMVMAGDSDTRDMARRVRMLISTSTHDIASPEFKQLITNELRWLDSEIAKGGSDAPKDARDRILNLGLAKNYEAQGDTGMANLVSLCRDYVAADKRYAVNVMTADIYPHSSREIEALYATLANPGDDPLVAYAASKIELTEDFKNDILGTKYLQEGRWAEALPYLQKVSQEYLDAQPIAFYAARRDYNIPAWYGFQTVGDSDYEETSKLQHLKRNAKVDFCRDMLRLETEAEKAKGAEKDKLALAQAAAMYQASRFGQCWYLSQYGFTKYEEPPVLDTELAGMSISLLRQCARSADPKVRAEALFGLVYVAPDRWMTETTDWTSPGFKTIVTVNTGSKQYSALAALNDMLKANPAAQTVEMSRCDVLRQWRKHESDSK